MDGILIPFSIDSIKKEIRKILQGQYSIKMISMAQVKLNTGQELYGVNDIFVGPLRQLSFRYSIEHKGKNENQCSSGIVISTGAGSTGWFKSIITGSQIIASKFEGIKIDMVKNQPFEWDSDYLLYCVREPFPSMTSRANLVFGRITKKEPLYLTSQTPDGAVIFSDGIDQDFLKFNSGNSAYVTLADKKARLINSHF